MRIRPKNILPLRQKQEFFPLAKILYTLTTYFLKIRLLSSLLSFHFCLHSKNMSKNLKTFSLISFLNVRSLAK